MSVNEMRCHFDCLQWKTKTFILVIYCVCYLLSFISSRIKSCEYHFYDLHLTVVYSRSQLISYNVADENIGHVSWFSHLSDDFLGQLNRAHKIRATSSIF